MCDLLSMVWQLVIGGDDLFSQPSKASISSKPASTKKTTAAAPLEDDLFTSKPSSGKKTKTEDSLFNKPPEDMFAATGSSKAKNSAGDIFAPSKRGGEDSKKLDDIFADAPPKK